MLIITYLIIPVLDISNLLLIQFGGCSTGVVINYLVSFSTVKRCVCNHVGTSAVSVIPDFSYVSNLSQERFIAIENGWGVAWIAIGY